MAEDDANAVAEARVDILKKTFSRITEKREKRIIDKLVNEYKNSELTANKAYSAIMAIAELRWAKGDIKKEDLG